MQRNQAVADFALGHSVAALDRATEAARSVSIPRKGGGYFVRVSGAPFAGKSGCRSDQSLCQFLDPFEMGRARGVEVPLVHPTLDCCAVGLKLDARDRQSSNTPYM
jgi:hypothetical protein